MTGNEGGTLVVFSRKDDIFASVGVAVLLIGTATGSAIAMFVLSAITLALMVVLYSEELRHKEYKHGILLALFVGAITSILISIILTIR